MVLTCSDYVYNVFLFRSIFLLPSAICINLGCPQRLARTHLFGAYLLDVTHRPSLLSIIHTLRTYISIPIICKIRLLPTLSSTRTLLDDLLGVGICGIIVHGRVLSSVVERRKGAANLVHIRSLVQYVNGRVPVITNGNVRCGHDILTNLR